jgi:hypothetical protein
MSGGIGLSAAHADAAMTAATPVKANFAKPRFVDNSTPNTP